MSETCGTCGAPLGNAVDLVEHTKTAHKDQKPTASLEMNPEAHRAGLVCALCGHRFPNARALAEHNLHPHSRPAIEPRVPGAAVV